MADTAVSITQLAVNTMGVDLVGGGTAVSTGNTAVITVGNDGGETNLFLALQETAAAALTLSVEAGDYPPAARSGLGALTLSLDASDVRNVVLEAGRFIQNNGTIRILVTGALKIVAYRMPKGY